MDIKQHQDSRLENLQNQISSLECTHQKKEIRCRTASNKTKMFKVQCVRCGELFGEWISHHKIKDPENIIEIDDNLIRNYNMSCNELRVALQDRIKELDKIDFFGWYKEYLKSPEWREKRLLVLDRCNDICEGCMKKVAEEVHHLTYANVGKEFLFELIGLCVGCHERIHEGREND